MGKNRDNRVLRGSSFLLALMLALGLACVALGTVPTARADGGAPNLAYVSGTKDGISVIDIASQSISATIKVDGDPRGMVLSADSRFLYVAQAQKNTVAVVDAHAHQVTSTLPVGAGPTAVTLDLISSSHLWVANTGSDTVTVLDPDAGKTLATVQVGLHPTSIAIANPTSGITETDGTSEVLVANHDGQSVSVLGSESFQVLTTVPLPNQERPIGVTVPGTGGTAYVSTDQGHVYGLTLAGHQFFGPIFTGQQLHFMDYDATNGEVYVPDSAANVVNILRPVFSGKNPPSKLPNEPARTLPIAGAPVSVAITNDGTLGLVAQQDTGNVTMLDVPGHKAVLTIHVGGAPQFLITGPFPPLVNRQSAQIIVIILYIIGGLLLVGAIGGFIWWNRRQEQRIRARWAAEDADLLRQLELTEAIQKSLSPPQAPVAQTPDAQPPKPNAPKPNTPNAPKKKKKRR
jgi:YVTN family beta-propeller protein